MDIRLQITTLISGIFLMAIVVYSLKKYRLYPSYVILWMIVALFLISITIFDELYRFIALSIIGVSGGDHLIYITLIGFLIMYIFYLTVQICSMSERISKLISVTAILENQIQKLVDEKIM